MDGCVRRMSKFLVLKIRLHDFLYSSSSTALHKDGKVFFPLVVLGDGGAVCINLGLS